MYDYEDWHHAPSQHRIGYTRRDINTFSRDMKRIDGRRPGRLQISRKDLKSETNKPKAVDF